MKGKQSISILVAIAVLAGLIIFSIYGNTQKHIPPSGPGGDVEGSHWRMSEFSSEHIGQTTPLSLENGGEGAFTLSFEDGAVQGRICNTFRGAYAANGFVIQAREIVSTKIACGTATSTIENDFFSALRNGVQYMRSDTRLELVVPGGVMHAVFLEQ